MKHTKYQVAKAREKNGRKPVRSSALLAEIRRAKNEAQRLYDEAIKQGQFVVASKLCCAGEEIRSAEGCWNHSISANEKLTR